jgi:hypothetical protein
MIMRVRVLTLLGVMAALCASASAQAPSGYVTVSGSHLTDFGGNLISSATLTFAPVDANGHPLSARINASGGQGITKPVTVTVASGAFSIVLADTSLTSPVNVCYQVTETDVASGDTYLSYPCVQPAANNSWCTSGACNFDAYGPSVPAIPPAQPFVVSINGVPGTWTFTTGFNCNTSTRVCTLNGASAAGDSDVLGQTASQGTVNLVTSIAAAQKFRISYYLDQNVLCASGSNSVLLTFSWTDGTLARTANSISLTLGSSASSTVGSVQGVLPIFASASSAITYTSTVTGSCATGGPSSYDAHISVEAVQ